MGTATEKRGLRAALDGLTVRWLDTSAGEVATLPSPREGVSIAIHDRGGTDNYMAVLYNPDTEQPVCSAKGAPFEHLLGAEEAQEVVRLLERESEEVLSCEGCGDPMVFEEEGKAVVCATCPRRIYHGCDGCGEMRTLTTTKEGEGLWTCKPCGKAARFVPQSVEAPPKPVAVPQSTKPVLKKAKKLATATDLGVFGAKELLKRYIANSDRTKPDKLRLLARELLKRIKQDPKKWKPYVLGPGKVNPKGKPTFAALVIKKRQSTKKANSSWTKKLYPDSGVAGDEKPKKDARKGIIPYKPADRPNEKFIKVEPSPFESVPSSAFKHHKIKHERLNPVQTGVLPWHNRDVNMVIAAPTSAGKTVMAEMVMADALAHKAKAAFLSPLRAVSQEKFDDWTHHDHPWSKRKVEIITGDYTLTDARKKALQAADVIVMTSEMLDSKTRRMAAEGNEWLLRLGVLVVDEAHLLTMEERGDALECGLMRFSRQNPDGRIVLLSATMPNIDELAKWLTKLNGKPTVVVHSDWRPTQLTLHWPTYRERGAYHATEQAKFDATLALLRNFPKDRFLAFVHSKKAGYELLAQARKCGIEAEFHSSDLDRDSRVRLERRFRDGNLRVVICTSTLAYGINMPARRVVIVGVHRGMEEVDSIDIKQMCGRAGRAGLEKQGDAYILVPEHRAVGIRQRILAPQEIESRLDDVDTLAFHLTAEIAEGETSTKEQIHEWYARSFAFHTGKQLAVDPVLEKLVKVGILKEDAGTYTATMLGRVSSWLYFSPFDVADWASNFRKLIELDRLRDDDCIAWALGTVKTAFKQHTPRDAEADMNAFAQRLRAKGIDNSFRLPTTALATLCCLKNHELKPIASAIRGVQHDGSRVVQAVEMIDRYVLKGLGESYTKLLAMRVQYRAGWDEAELCQVPGIGGKRAQALVRAGMRRVADIVERPAVIRRVLGAKVAEAAIRAAKGILHTRRKSFPHRK